jgi:hypothetical protein
MKRLTHLNLLETLCWLSVYGQKRIESMKSLLKRIKYFTDVIKLNQEVKFSVQVRV